MKETENIGKLAFSYAVPNITGKPIGIAVIYTNEEMQKYDENQRNESFKKMLYELI